MKEQARDHVEKKMEKELLIFHLWLSFLSKENQIHKEFELLFSANITLPIFANT